MARNYFREPGRGFPWLSNGRCCRRDDFPASRAGSSTSRQLSARIFAPAGQSNYAAAKAGVFVALTQSLAKEVARLGITVNAVCPGYLETEMLDKMDPATRQRVLMQVPMRRFGQPAEVAEVVRFLALLRRGLHHCGSALKIDGGIF